MNEELFNSDCTPLTSDEEEAAIDGSGIDVIGNLNEVESDGDALAVDDDISPVLSDQGSLIQRGLPALPIANGIQTSPNRQAGGVSSSTRFSSLISPLVKPLRRFAYRRRKKSIRKLVGSYCRCLVSMVPKDSIPRQAVMIFETIFGSELPTHNDGRANIIHHEDSPSQRTMTTSKFSGQAVIKLCDFLQASLKMVDSITSACAIVDQTLNAECMIDIGTEEHKLCAFFVQRLSDLLKRFNVLSSAATTTFQKFLNSSFLHGLLCLPQLVNVENINSRILTSIFPSTVGSIKSLCSMAIGAVIRFSAFTCSLMCQKTLDSFETKLSNLVNDLNISIQEFDSAMDYSTKEYGNRKASLALQHLSPEPPVSNHFSREYKIFKQYEDILRAGNLLVERLSTAKDLANELVNVERDSIDKSVDLADRIAMEQSEAYQISKRLHSLMEIQTLLVKQLKFKPQFELDTNPVPGTSMRTEVLEPLNYDTNIEVEQILRNEYQSSGSEDSGNVETIENKDEVFIAITSGEEACETTEDFSRFDGDDKKLVKQSYSRLVTELKGSIEHLHQNTLRRENEAQKTIYGNPQLDLADDLDSNEPSAMKQVKEVEKEDSCSLRYLSERDILVDEFDGLHSSKRMEFSNKRRSVIYKSSDCSRNSGGILEDEWNFTLDPNIKQVPKKSQRHCDVDPVTTSDESVVKLYPGASIIGELNTKIKSRKPALGST
ncbi:unnamed protein product [Orchesella dallaii]